MSRIRHPVHELRRRRGYNSRVIAARLRLYNLQRPSDHSSIVTTVTCPACGAPDNGEFALCHYCNAPFSPEIAESAVVCPACGVHCRSGRERCGACNAWIVVACVFCGAHSPHNVPACLACQEPFAGAPERKAELDRARAVREAGAEAAQVIGVVGSILGVVVEAEELANRRRW